MKQNLISTKESGRSMVEMLGVLAIVGVLSLTALYGFKIAMDMYHSNELTREVNVRGADLVTQAIAHNNDLEGLSLNGYPDTTYQVELVRTAGGDIASWENDDGLTGFTLRARGVPTTVCKRAFSLIKTDTNIVNIIINDRADDTHELFTEADRQAATALCNGDEDNNTMLFDFSVGRVEEEEEGD